MILVVDTTTLPHLVLLMTDDPREATDVAQRYANQTGRQLDVYDGDVVASIARKVEPVTEYNPFPEVVAPPRSVDGT
jgi:hypothetical protein